MHELLAMLYFAVDFDSVAAGSSVAAPLDELCAQTWVAGDAWALFVHVMNGVGRWCDLLIHYFLPISNTRLGMNGGSRRLSRLPIHRHPQPKVILPKRTD
jgi:hypothetical protein